MYVLSLDLNVDVDDRERSEGGSVFQHMGAFSFVVCGRWCVAGLCHRCSRVFCGVRRI